MPDPSAIENFLIIIIIIIITYNYVLHVQEIKIPYTLFLKSPVAAVKLRIASLPR